MVSLIAFVAFLSLLALNALRSGFAGVALVAFVSFGSGVAGVSLVAFLAAIPLKTAFTLRSPERDRSRPVGVSSGELQIHIPGVGVHVTEVGGRIIILGEIFQRAGGIDAEGGSGFPSLALNPLIAFIPFVSLFTLDSLNALRPGFPGVPLVSLFAAFPFGKTHRLGPFPGRGERVAEPPVAVRVVLTGVPVGGVLAELDRVSGVHQRVNLGLGDGIALDRNGSPRAAAPVVDIQPELHDDTRRGLAVVDADEFRTQRNHLLRPDDRGEFRRVGFVQNDVNLVVDDRDVGGRQLRRPFRLPDVGHHEAPRLVRQFLGGICRPGGGEDFHHEFDWQSPEEHREGRGFFLGIVHQRGGELIEDERRVDLLHLRSFPFVLSCRSPSCR